MKNLIQKLMGRIAWMFLRAAQFDVIAEELLEAVNVYADPAAVIPTRLAELKGADQRLEKKLDRELASLHRRVAHLEERDGMHEKANREILRRLERITLELDNSDGIFFVSRGGNA